MRSIFSMILFMGLIGSTFIQAQQTAPIGPYGRLLANTATQSTATATLTPGQVAGYVHVNTNAGAATLTLPSATLLCRLFPFVQGSTSGTVNFSWDWYLVNNGTATVTLVAGAGTTLVPSAGVLTVIKQTVQHYFIILTNCGATPAANAAQLIDLGNTLF